MKIATLQLEIRDDETKQERIDRVDSLLDDVNDVDMVVLPEIWATGYFSFDKYTEEAEEINGPFAQHFSEKAKKMNCYIFAGSFVEKDEGRYYNTSIMFNQDGEVIGTYRKMHLFRYGSKEGEILTRGEEPTVIDTAFGKIGLTTCYDLRFPELYRAQVDLGAEIFLVTSAWPHQRLEHWNIFNVARALENQCYLVSCNCAGITQGVKLGGHSQIIDPFGTVIKRADEIETTIRADIDLSQIEKIRETFPQLKHRVIERGVCAQ
ncbi:carbon-nitrogen family hydrolase [Alteribacillus sp. YIM 98480]|uniref:carbon-nitrogen family hydrolase n=1 Tax=Alteribacillus sp. YIM 98480 TaxID=2606599 RepID=UPI00131A7873|nr:carbon-nitrogen family hydrolase [Alteribacillus sp. YIM 98480]